MIEMFEFDDIDLAVVKIRGKLTFKEIEQAVHNFAEMGKFRKRKYQLSDVRQVHLDASSEQITELIKLLKTTHNYIRASKVVYLADNPSSTATAYLLCHAFHEDLRSGVFSTVDAAIQSLGLLHYQNMITGYLEGDN